MLNLGQTTFQIANLHRFVVVHLDEPPEFIRDLQGAQAPREADPHSRGVEISNSDRALLSVCLGPSALEGGTPGPRPEFSLAARWTLLFAHVHRSRRKAIRKSERPKLTLT